MNKNQYIKILKSENETSEYLRHIKGKELSFNEVSHLTRAMNELSTRFVWEDEIKPRLDLPSTGGTGNITPIVVSLLAASTEKVYVPKVSTRSFKHTGGTIDILESVGYQADVETDLFMRIVKENYISIVNHRKQLTPVDSKLVEMRKKTDTLSHPDLISSSILNNKWILGLDTVLLDCKIGRGGGIKNRKDAERLINVFTKLGQSLGIRSAVAITYNESPQCMNIGNKLSLYEVIHILKGKGEEKIQSLCCDLTANLIAISEFMNDVNEAKRLIQENIRKGRAIQKLKDLFEWHGVEVIGIIDSPELLLEDSDKYEIKSEKAGYLDLIDGEVINKILRSLIFENDKLVDYHSGVQIVKRPGARIEKDEDVMFCYIWKNSRRKKEFKAIIKDIKSCVKVVEEQPEFPPNLLMDIITE